MISVAQAQQSGCSGTIEFQPASLLLDHLTNLHGDTNTGNNPVRIEVRARLESRGTSLILTGVIRISEQGGDRTTFEKHYSKQIRMRSHGQLPTGCILTPGRIDVGTINRVTSRRDRQTFRGSGIIDRARCSVSSRVFVPRLLGCNVYFKKVRIPLKRQASQEQPNCGTLQVPIDRAKVFPLFRQGGDNEMGGNPVDIDVWYWLSHTDRRITMHMRVQMRETVPNYSRFERWRHNIHTPVLQLRDGCRITGFVSNAKGWMRVRSQRNTHTWTSYSGRGDIRSINCRSDSRGRDDGKLGCELRLHDLVVKTGN